MNFWKTPVYSLLLFMMVLASSESIIRHGRLDLPAPSIGNGYKPADIQFYELQKFADARGEVDCIFLGSSMVLNGLNPMAFESGYLEETSDAITCYNFGLQGLTAATAGSIAEVLVKRYHPKLLIYGTQARDYDGRAEDTVINTFPETPWMRYQLGDATPEGWLMSHSHLYPYLHTVPEWLFPIKHWERGVVTEAKRQQGYIPQLRYERGASPIFVDSYTPRLEEGDPVLSDEDYAGLQKLIGLADETQVIILAMPQYQAAPPKVGSSDFIRQQIFNDLMTDTRQKGVPFWSMDYMELLPASAWVDDWHLQVVGSAVFSEWLGRQLGEAMQADELPLNFPLSDMPLSDELSAFSEQPSDAVIFNPASGEYERGFLGDTISLYLDWSIELDDTERQHLQTLLDSLAQMRYESELALMDEQVATLTEWRSTKQAELLQAADVDYLLVSDTWLSWLTDDELAILKNQYQEVDRWRHPVLDEGYYLLTWTTE